jgi:hypothetical protein
MYISKQTLNSYQKDDKYFNGERILLRETGNSLTALYLQEKMYSNRSLYSLIVNDKSYNTKYVLACLNSRAAQFYYETIFKNDTDLFPKIRIKQAKMIPIPSAPISQQSHIISLIDDILIAKNGNIHADTTELEQQIDSLFYSLYGFSNEEIRLVENDEIPQS